MKGLTYALLLVAAITLCLNVACNKANTADVREPQYTMATDSDKRYEMPGQHTDKAYQMFRDFDLYLVETAKMLNAAKGEGVPDVILKAAPGSATVLNYANISEKGVLIAEVQVSFAGDPPNIREHKRAMAALGASGVEYNRVQGENRKAFGATTTHAFFADIENGRWVICPTTGALLARGISLEIAYKMQQTATNTLERHIKKILAAKGA